MTIYNAPTVECFIYTYKDGLLSKVAHDLKLRVSDCQVTFDSQGVEATFDPTSIEVIGALKAGAVDSRGLSSKDKQSIQSTIRKDVLHTEKYHEIRFRTTEMTSREDGGYQLRGELSLHGHTRDLALQAKRDGDHLIVETVLHKPDYGIKPYHALMGALKLKPDVKVELRIPAE